MSIFYGRSTSYSNYIQKWVRFIFENSVIKIKSMILIKHLIIRKYLYISDLFEKICNNYFFLN